MLIKKRVCVRVGQLEERGMRRKYRFDKDFRDIYSVGEDGKYE